MRPVTVLATAVATLLGITSAATAQRTRSLVHRLRWEVEGELLEIDIDIPLDDYMRAGEEGEELPVGRRLSRAVAWGETSGVAERVRTEAAAHDVDVLDAVVALVRSAIPYRLGPPAGRDVRVAIVEGADCDDRVSIAVAMLAPLGYRVGQWQFAGHAHAGLALSVPRADADGGVFRLANATVADPEVTANVILYVELTGERGVGVVPDEFLDAPVRIYFPARVRAGSVGVRASSDEAAPTHSRSATGDPSPDPPDPVSSPPPAEPTEEDGESAVRRHPALCTDASYEEALPDTSIGIDDLILEYDPDAVGSFVDHVLARRYPLGRQLVAEGLAGGHDCVAAFLSDTSTADAVLGDIGTVVHECGHMADLARARSAIGGVNANAYVITSSLVLAAADGDTEQRHGRTFERSRIRTDAYDRLWPACTDPFGRHCDSYAGTYLEGDPDDATFESGDQGFNLLLEELAQYVNSLATDYALGDHLRSPGAHVSRRDGVLTFLWYVERYLHLARTSYPAAYEHLAMGDAGRWRRAILSVWARAQRFLRATEGDDWLGIDDEEIGRLVGDAQLSNEIRLLRLAEGCP